MSQRTETPEITVEQAVAALETLLEENCDFFAPAIQTRLVRLLVQTPVDHVLIHYCRSCEQAEIHPMLLGTWFCNGCSDLETRTVPKPA